VHVYMMHDAWSDMNTIFPQLNTGYYYFTTQFTAVTIREWATNQGRH